jgi:hypothetical protein
MNSDAISKWTNNEHRRRLIKALAARGVAKSVTVDDLEAELGDEDRYDRWAIIADLKDLQGHIRGRFVAGRRGKPSRLETDFPLKDFDSDNVDGTPNSVAAAPRPEKPTATSSGTSVTEEAAGETKTLKPGDAGRDLRQWQFPLRENLVVSVELPLDLTEREAERLATWVGALAVGGDR